MYYVFILFNETTIHQNRPCSIVFYMDQFDFKANPLLIRLISISLKMYV